MVNVVGSSKAAERAALEQRMQAASLAGYWQEHDRPQKLKPWVWRWPELIECLEQSGEVIELGQDTARRTVQMVNPAYPSQTSRTLQLSLQLVKPGEVAECHRHTQSALRFVVQGQGAYTTVEGERMLMAPGDLILTPNWTWHDHTNNTGEPAIWLDGHDAPLVRHLSAQVFELYELFAQEVTKPDGYSQRQLGLLRPPAAASGHVSPPVHYTWQDTERALEAAAAGPGDPFDDAIVAYVNPLTGGPTMPTIGCYAQMLRPGVTTQAHRHTSVAIYHVVRGSGFTEIDGERFDWAERDCFVVPPLSSHRHANASASDPAILFSMTDRPVLEALRLYREEPTDQDQD